jgi:BASS family bile acid:Na+ symporter
VGLAAAVFIPWMNISGSLLANYWRRHKPASIASRLPKCR